VRTAAHIACAHLLNTYVTFSLFGIVLFDLRLPPVSGSKRLQLVERAHCSLPSLSYRALEFTL
jgi:hypothetical protein